MADILIRGMEKPGSCRECDFCELQDINFEILYFCNRNDRFLDDEEVCNIPNDCPIIELPEHGDLIDIRNAVNAMFALGNYHLNDYEKGWNDGIKAVIENAPVIVPSNKEDAE